jgi:hypothetical protein
MIPYYGTYKGHPVRVLYREDDLVYLRTADKSLLYRGYLDTPVCIDTWALEDEVISDDNECRCSEGNPFACGTCKDLIAKTCLDMPYSRESERK